MSLREFRYGSNCGQEPQIAPCLRALVEGCRGKKDERYLFVGEVFHHCRAGHSAEISTSVEEQVVHEGFNGGIVFSTPILWPKCNIAGAGETRRASSFKQLDYHYLVTNIFGSSFS